MLLALPSFAVERSCELRHLAIFRLLVRPLSAFRAPNPTLRFQRFTVYTRSVAVALVLLVVLTPETASPDPIETRCSLGMSAGHYLTTLAYQTAQTVVHPFRVCYDTFIRRYNALVSCCWTCWSCACTVMSHPFVFCADLLKRLIKLMTKHALGLFKNTVSCGNKADSYKRPV